VPLFLLFWFSLLTSGLKITLLAECPKERGKITLALLSFVVARVLASSSSTRCSTVLMDAALGTSFRADRNVQIGLKYEILRSQTNKNHRQAVLTLLAQKSYSECNACNGSKRAAFIAGITPETIPISKESKKAAAT
jgi:hypothetical protein